MITALIFAKDVETELRLLQDKVDRDAVRRRKYANELLETSPETYDEAGIEQIVRLYKKAVDEDAIRDDIKDTMRLIGKKLYTEADKKYKVGR